MIIALFSSLAFTVVVFILLKAFGSKGQINQQKMISDRIAVSSSPGSTTLNLRKRNYISDVAGVNRFLTQFNISVHISTLLSMARLKVSASVFFLASLMVGAIIFIVSVRTMPLANAVIAGLAGIPLLYIYLIYKKKQYLKKFEEYFPNALNLLSSSLKVGHVLEAGIEAVSNSAPFPINDEFKAVLAEMKLGMNLSESLVNLYRRIGSEELKIFVTGVAINSELGGNLSEIIDNIEKTVRERFALKREIDALSAQGKMSALVLFCLPLVMGFYMYLNNKTDFTAFFSSKPGRMCIWLMICTQFISFVGIKKAIKLQD